MSVILYCEDSLKKGCSWSGDSSELVSASEGFEVLDFNHCPYCGGIDFYEEEEEE
jgi:hypothetical protein